MFLNSCFTTNVILLTQNSLVLREKINSVPAQSLSTSARLFCAFRLTVLMVYITYVPNRGFCSVKHLGLFLLAQGRLYICTIV